MENPQVLPLAARWQEDAVHQGADGTIVREAGGRERSGPEESNDQLIASFEERGSDVRGAGIEDGRVLSSAKDGGAHRPTRIVKSGNNVRSFSQ